MNDEQKPKRDIAVALQYERGGTDAPRVTAKGYGEVARKIVDLAAANGVVIESNPHLAEALSGVELDDTIPIELYQAVAEVIGYVLRTQDRIDGK